MTSRRLSLAFVALVVIAAASFGASFLPLERASVPVALAFAVVKAAVVAVVFMELGDGPASPRLTLVVAIALGAILIGFAAADVATRAT